MSQDIQFKVPCENLKFDVSEEFLRKIVREFTPSYAPDQITTPKVVIEIRQETLNPFLFGIVLHQYTRLLIRVEAPIGVKPHTLSYKTADKVFGLYHIEIFHGMNFHSIEVRKLLSEAKYHGKRTKKGELQFELKPPI